MAILAVERNRGLKVSIAAWVINRGGSPNILLTRVLTAMLRRFLVWMTISSRAPKRWKERQAVSNRWTSMWLFSVDCQIAMAKSCCVMRWLLTTMARPNSIECARHGERVIRPRFGPATRGYGKRHPGLQRVLLTSETANGCRESRQNWNGAN